MLNDVRTTRHAVCSRLTAFPAVQDFWCTFNKSPDSIFDQLEIRASWAVEFVHARMGGIESVSAEGVKACGILRDKLPRVSLLPFPRMREHTILRVKLVETVAAHAGERNFRSISVGLVS